MHHDLEETAMRFRTPSPATMLASAALFVALTGTAAAGALITGAQIKNNTVSTLDLKNESVRSADVLDNSLTSLDIRNGTLEAVDFAPGQLPAGAQGQAGPQGPPGPPGQQGGPGLAGLEIVTAVSPTDSDEPKQVDVACPAGKRVVGGGAHLWDAAGKAALDESYPKNETEWRATAYEVVATALNWHMSAYAICAAVA